jgi:hypothetical protein
MGWTCRMRPILEAHQSALDMTQEWLRKGQNPRGYAFEVMTGAGEVVFKVPLAEALDRQVGHRPVNVPRAVKTAMTRGNRIMRLSAEVAEQVRLVRENLDRSRDLSNSLGKARAG